MPQVKHATTCKLLAYKGQYKTCHIGIPQAEGKRIAVAVDGRYFRFFRRFDTAQQVMAVAERLAQRGSDFALTESFKDNKKGYRVWLYTPNVENVTTEALDGPLRLPVYGPSPCFMIFDQAHYRPCYIKVPDLPQPRVAIYYDKRFYSVCGKGLSAVSALELGQKLVGRGDEVAIASTDQTYVVCLWEPEAIPYQPPKT
ncbi:MAG: hypothetical protein AAGF01_10080 [Cyanobacteria bacterium P01_G01_bin.38]